MLYRLETSRRKRQRQSGGGCFSSNIARLITLARIAKETGRYFALFGRSLQNTVGAAKATGHWPDDLPVLDAFNTGYLLPEEVLAVATGSQGEPRAALNQLAKDTYRSVSLDEGDSSDIQLYCDPRQRRVY